jgi:hypothetical protein
VIIALWAALAMLVNDIAAVLLVQAEARNRGGLAALFDSLMWLASITTTSVSVTTLQGHHLSAKVTVIAAVEIANVLGCIIGVAIGRRLIRETKAACACGCPAPAKEAQ